MRCRFAFGADSGDEAGADVDVDAEAELEAACATGMLVGIDLRLLLLNVGEAMASTAEARAFDLGGMLRSKALLCTVIVAGLVQLLSLYVDERKGLSRGGGSSVQLGKYEAEGSAGLSNGYQFSLWRYCHTFVGSRAPDTRGKGNRRPRSNTFKNIVLSAMLSSTGANSEMH